MSTFAASETPTRPSASAWHTLERMAAARKSTATVYQLLARLTLPKPTVPPKPPRQAPGAGNLSALAIDSAPFHQWAALTDAYAHQFLLMQRGDPKARAEALRLSREMLRMNEEMACSA
jgi:putative heme degradation protein